MPETLQPQDIVMALKSDFRKLDSPSQAWEFIDNEDVLAFRKRRKYDFSKRIQIKPERADKFSKISILFINIKNTTSLPHDKNTEHIFSLLGQSIREHIREEDIAIKKGENQFILLILGMSADAAKKTIARRLQSMLDGELLFSINNEEFQVFGDITVNEYNQKFSPFENIMRTDRLSNLN